VAAPPRLTVERPRKALVTLTQRRLALSIRTPRELVVPLMTPILFALVIAPALAHTVAGPGGRTAYMTFVALATAGLLIPLNSMFAGLGVIVDRQHGAMRELLVAPVRKSSIVLANLVAVLAITTLQLTVLVVASALRGARFVSGMHVVWFVAAAVALVVAMHGLAEIMTVRLPSAEAYIGAVPAVAIVPFFFAGSLFPITSLPGWLGAVAKALPLTHALALFRYGLTGRAGVTALHNIWGLSNATAMAFLSLAVVVAYAGLSLRGALRLFEKARSS
jgi:ABC-2 type transport system permease protein